MSLKWRHPGLQSLAVLLYSAFLPSSSRLCAQLSEDPGTFSSVAFLGMNSERPDCTVKWDFTTAWPSLLANVCKTLRVHFQGLNREYAWLEKSSFPELWKTEVIQPISYWTSYKKVTLKPRNFDYISISVICCCCHLE